MSSFCWHLLRKMSKNQQYIYRIFTKSHFWQVPKIVTKTASFGCIWTVILLSQPKNQLKLCCISLLMLQLIYLLLKIIIITNYVNCVWPLDGLIYWIYTFRYCHKVNITRKILKLRYLFIAGFCQKYILNFGHFSQ